MTAKTLNHITDLHLLDDAEVAQFATELPGIVSSLRVAARSAKESGQSLADAFPGMTFVSELKDATVFRGADQSLQVDHGAIQKVDAAPAVADHAIERARACVTPEMQAKLNQALFESASHGSALACELLIAQGAQVNCRGRIDSFHGSGTPLHMAAASGHTDVCRLLIKAGANVNARDDQGNAVVRAMHRGSHREVGLLLVAYGADTLHACQPPDSDEAYQNDYPLRVGSTDFKGMSMHTAAVRLGDMERIAELIAQTSLKMDDPGVKEMISTAKSSKKPEILAFIQAQIASNIIANIRQGSAPKGP